MRIFTLVLTVGFLAGGAARGEQAVQRANSVERIVRYEYPVTNTADKPQDVRVYLALPRPNARQEIVFLYPQPGYERIFEDEFGNRIAEYCDRGVQPGEVRRHGWMAAVKTYAAVFHPSAGVEPLGEADRARYTRDTPKYLISDPGVTALRDALIRPGMSDYEKAAAVFHWFVENVTYLRDDKWDTAPEVIQRKQGSCSEYTYSILSLMRSAGVPCRYTGGVMISTANKTRYDEKVHEDAVFHRWAEVYLKDYGWFPVDGSRGAGATRRFGNNLHYWGQLTADGLQTYCGDGGGPLDWDYVAFARGEVRNSVKTDGVCFWIEAPLERLEPAIQEVNRALEEKMPPATLAKLAAETLTREVLFLLLDRLDRARYPQLAEELLKAKHPAAVYLGVYCDRLGVPMPSFITFPTLTDDYLRSEILKHRAAGAWDWRSLERWWRKARPIIAFSEERRVFVMTTRTIDLN
ncbi:MAG: transglutaminase domain-containing protein [Phycisphaerae bacterium]|jgi:transglutaminase-like putative cysteine protease